MRTYLLVAVSALSLSLGACSSDNDLKPYGDELFPNEQANVNAIPQQQAVPTVPVNNGYDQSQMNYGSATPGSQDDLSVNVGDRVFFGYDSYNLTPEGISQLELQAQWLRQYPSTNVAVEGHADERGTREYNLALGDRRANAVKNYLVSLGVDPRRVQTLSYGKERPEMLGANSESWARNRRSVTSVQ
ncbi:MAG: peptidoglycan-associated lipoprotein [Alphaproteobacteria bacterium]|nr:MAG: peptidoglycan-associated lipoprotein [Alphaproteobacteria bacterium]